VVRYLSLSQLTRNIRRPGFWFIFALLVLITLLHYGQDLGFSLFHAPIMADLGLDRHAFERILYLVPIVLAGFVFSWRGAFVTSLIALAGMLPRAIFISPHPLDALLETAAVFTVGNAVSIS
jgi:glucose-6-phosphate-specific signal transduction histidine kinase